METAPSRPAALAWSTENCQVERAMAVLGERATLLVLREVFNGVRRFDDMRRHSGVSRQVLTDRLALLVEHGILRRVPYKDAGRRERQEYRLTGKGFDLYPVLVAVAGWGARYYSGPEGAAVEMAHRACGAPVTATLTCGNGHEVAVADVAPRPGPGARPARS
jgi:DNA-binding HxlR family transcriptional regulator